MSCNFNSDIIVSDYEVFAPTQVGIMCSKAKVNPIIFGVVFSLPVSANAQVVLSEAIEKISTHFDVAITYPAGMVNQYQIEEIPLHGTIQRALTDLLQNTDLTFGVSEQGVIIKPAKVTLVTQDDKKQSSDAMEEVVMVAQPLRRFPSSPTTVTEAYNRTLLMKRQTIGFSDSLMASSIAAFPHQNLAEALQHIPGMSVERNKGLGTQVNVRGLPNSFSHVSINGLATASGSSGRDVEFDMFAPEIVQTVTIKKSPTAADKEGGIAGNVYIRTARPFEQGEGKIRFTAEAAHNSISDVIDPAFSLVANEEFDNWAGLISFSQYSRTNRTDGNSGIDFRPLSRWSEKDGSEQAILQAQQTLDVLYRDTGIAISDPLDKNETARIVFINKVGDRVYVNKQEKWGITGSLQHRANPQLLYSLDLMLGAYDTREDEYDIAAYSASSSSALEQVHSFDSLTLSHHGITVLTDASYSDTQHEMLSRERSRNTDYQQISLETDWQGIDWKINGLLGYSNAEKTSQDSNLKHTAYAPSRNRFTAMGGENLPSAHPDSIDMYSTPEAYNFDHYDVGVSEVADKQYTAQFDAQYQFSPPRDNGLNRFHFGFRYTDTSKEHNGGEVRFTAPATVDDSNQRSLIDSELTNIADLVPGGNFSLKDGRHLMWQQVSNAYARQTFRPENLQIPLEEQQYYRVDEEVLALYTMLDFIYTTGERVHTFNTGIRYIDTNILSFGYHQIQHADGSDGFSSRPISQTGSYSRALPSMNLTAELTDKLVLRVAGSETLIRPSLSDIAYKRTANLSDFKYHDGNPDLSPTLAKQWEAGLEWYPQRGALLSTSYFSKRIEGVVREVLTGVIRDVTKYNDNGSIDGTYDFNIYQHVNADNHYNINGVELIAQLPLSIFHPFFSGMHINANYIRLNNDLTGQSDIGVKTPPEGLSEEAFNIIAYYENNALDLHLSYSYKGAYVDYIERDMYPVYRDGYGQFDVSFGYRVNDGIKISLQGINITNEVTQSYTFTPTFPSQFEMSGRRLILGLSISL